MASILLQQNKELKAGSFKEAIVYLKESLKLTVELYGWDNTDVFELFDIIVECYRGLLRHDEILKFYEKLLGKWRMLMEKESSIKGWIRDVEDSPYEIRGRTKEFDESSHRDDKNEADGGNEAQYEGRELSLDDIFNAEPDTSKDISLEGLKLDEDFLLKFKKGSEGFNGRASTLTS
ncbi:hypothetical protein EAF00_007427 [Botryotinia globosa]|nr:hypothetical protein EAF00_007427 [Botryotinia globosa]